MAYYTTVCLFDHTLTVYIHSTDGVIGLRDFNRGEVGAQYIFILELRM